MGFISHKFYLFAFFVLPLLAVGVGERMIQNTLYKTMKKTSFVKDIDNLINSCP